MNPPPSIPTVTVNLAGGGASTSANNMGMRAMQERIWQWRRVQYLLIKSPRASKGAGTLKGKAPSGQRKRGA